MPQSKTTKPRRPSADQLFKLIGDWGFTLLAMLRAGALDLERQYYSPEALLDFYDRVPGQYSTVREQILLTISRITGQSTEYWLSLLERCRYRCDQQTLHQVIYNLAIGAAASFEDYHLLHQHRKIDFMTLLQHGQSLADCKKIVERLCANGDKVELKHLQACTELILRLVIDFDSAEFAVSEFTHLRLQRSDDKEFNQAVADFYSKLYARLVAYAVTPLQYYRILDKRGQELQQPLAETLRLKLEQALSSSLEACQEVALACTTDDFMQRDDRFAPPNILVRWLKYHFGDSFASWHQLFDEHRKLHPHSGGCVQRVAREALHRLATTVPEFVITALLNRGYSSESLAERATAAAHGFAETLQVCRLYPRHEPAMVKLAGYARTHKQWETVFRQAEGLRPGYGEKDAVNHEGTWKAKAGRRLVTLAKTPDECLVTAELIAPRKDLDAERNTLLDQLTTIADELTRDQLLALYRQPSYHNDGSFSSTWTTDWAGEVIAARITAGTF